MFTSFSTALSALNANSTAIDVVGNNLANLNTPGFQIERGLFPRLGHAVAGRRSGETQVGFGTGRPLTIRQFTQGSIQASTGVLDAAIQGDGFFVLKNAQGNNVYTRAGSFYSGSARQHADDYRREGARLDGHRPHDRGREHQRADRQHRGPGGQREAGGSDHEPLRRYEPERGGRGRILQCQLRNIADGLRFAGRAPRTDAAIPEDRHELLDVQRRHSGRRSLRGNGRRALLDSQRQRHPQVRQPGPFDRSGLRRAGRRSPFRAW